MTDRFAYDAKCGELAKYFLAAFAHTTEHEQKLAQTIQDAIEDWMGEFERLFGVAACGAAKKQAGNG